MFKTTLFSAAIVAGLTTPSFAETVISGTVQAKCAIFTDITGVYGNPLPYKLSTISEDGGVTPIVRFDIAAADYYKARIAYPTSFSTSPTLSDTVTWEGDVSINKVSDVSMADYQSAKVQYDNIAEFDLSEAGTVWFEIDSIATYGYNRALPAGTYSSIVVAECIAK